MRQIVPHAQYDRAYVVSEGSTTTPSASHQTVVPGWNVAPPKLIATSVAPIPVFPARRGTGPRASTPDIDRAERLHVTYGAVDHHASPTVGGLRSPLRGRASRATDIEAWPSTIITWPCPGRSSKIMQQEVVVQT